MARFAFDRSGAPDGDRPSISLHPAFPAIVASWSAALLGAGSLVLPSALLERGLEATGIAVLIPSATAPFGMAARGLIALAAALTGALAGMVIARRVSRAHSRRGPGHEAPPLSGARRPLHIHEELGGDSLFNSVGWPGAEHRATAIAEDDQTSDGPCMASPADSDRVSSTELEMSEPVGADLEPLPFSAPSLARRAQMRPKPGLRESAAAPLPWPRTTDSDCSGWAGDEPGLAQLVRRLGAAVERRRVVRANSDSATTAAQVAAEGIAPVPDGDAFQAIAMPTSEAADFAEPEWMKMSRLRRDKTDVVSLRRARVPRPEPSTVLADTDTALRAALASLRRMNGTA